MFILIDLIFSVRPECFFEQCEKKCIEGSCSFLQGIIEFFMYCKTLRYTSPCSALRANGVEDNDQYE